MNDNTDVPGRAEENGARRLRVLVVDDCAALRETLCDVLCCWEMHAESVPDGEAARAALGRSEFDVALVDMVMPGIDGVSLIRECQPFYPAT